MRLRFLVLAGLMMAAALAAGDNGRPVVFVGHEQVMAALDGQTHGGGPLVKAPDLLVMGAHRAEAGHVEVHDKETDVFYIVDGEATLITGGKMLGGKVTSPGQWLGASIEGGEAHHLVKGDVIVIPAGIPHWFKSVPHTVSYFVVKVLK